MTFVTEMSQKQFLFSMWRMVVEICSDNNFFFDSISFEKWSFFCPNGSSSATSDKVFSAKNCFDVNEYNVCYISQQLNCRFRYRALRALRDQWRQLYKQKKDYGSRTSFLSRRLQVQKEDNTEECTCWNSSICQCQISTQEPKIEDSCSYVFSCHVQLHIGNIFSPAAR